jgi:S-adenosylmethionine:tRNA ribosyltransferase-isomerase
MLLSEFDYFLPEELIAKEPIHPRDHSKLLVIDRKSGSFSHHHFYDLPKFFQNGDCLVRNTSKVIPARILGETLLKQRIEIFLLKKTDSNSFRWKCLVKPGKRIKTELEVILKDQSNVLVKKRSETDFEVFLPESSDLWSWLEKVGEPPLPPYIKRKVTPEDTKRYQTVFAKESGSVAAPTAGLHFSEKLIEQLDSSGVQFADITLHVGYGTFSPIRTEKIEEHQMHGEFYSISSKTVEQLKATRHAGKKVFAVGTTSLRALESMRRLGTEGETHLFISPGYEFKEIDGLITNFHLPQSSLFVLVCALLGTDLCKRAYQEAIENRYRFYSYGDAMLVL